MTDLEIKYADLVEKKRANLASEQLEQINVTSSAAQRYATVEKTQVETKKVEHEIDKVLAEIEKIQADTRLSDQKRRESVANTIESWMSTISDGAKIAAAVIAMLA